MSNVSKHNLYNEYNCWSKGKKHNPNYTVDAVNYLGEYVKKLTEKQKKKELISEEQKKVFVDSFDWGRMTAQDESVWAEIFKTLDA